MKFVRHTFLITGVSPLLMSNPEFTLPANDADSDLPDTRKLGKKSKAEQAELLAYRLPNRQLYGPSAGFRNGMLLACTGFKIGKKTTANKVISASVFNVEDKCALFNPETGKPIAEYVIDTRRVVNHNTKPPSAFMAHRPCVQLPWATELTLEIDLEWYDDGKGHYDLGIPLKFLQRAGSIAGWCAFRPEKRGWFGRYLAVLKQVKEDKKEGKRTNNRVLDHA